jgi:hypothetical protein
MFDHGTFDSDTILNYQLFQKLKLIGISKFNQLIITLTNMWITRGGVEIQTNDLSFIRRGS